MRNDPVLHRRHRVIGVIGSGEQAFTELAEPLGAWIAEEGFSLVTGGLGGVMEAVSRAFFEVQPRVGVVIGILPAQGAQGAAVRDTNPWVEIEIRTHLPKLGAEGTDPMSRNHINVLSAQVVVALPGGWGTRSEIELAQRYRRPIIAYLGTAGTIAGLPGNVAIARTLEEVKNFVLDESSDELR